MVVLAKEDYRSLPERGEVQGLVEVALRGGPVAEEGEDGRSSFAPLPHCVRDAHGVEGLGAEDDGDGEVSPAPGVRDVPIFEPVVEKESLGKAFSPHQAGAGLAEGPDEPVFLFQCESGGAESSLQAGAGGKVPILPWRWRFNIRWYASLERTMAR